MNWKFVLRGLVIATIILALGAVAVYLYFSQFSVNIPTGSIPSPPTILAPEGALPESQVGLKEWAKYGETDYVPVGNGFFLKLADDSSISLNNLKTTYQIADEIRTRKVKQ